ncbi:MAG TPA: endo-1,4-beta-xylanase [Tepidisphaeraceae bacterium]|jgi:GH35 family endo-1,4-beta-xylanase|nr:endo-1,4-beta-xylanase [Tepidisphaeraceae bacterium]
MPRKRRYLFCSLFAACAPVVRALGGSQFTIQSSLIRSRRRQQIAVTLLAMAGIAQSACAQTSLTGSALKMASNNSATLGTTGYVGTYLVVPSGGAVVNFSVNSTEGASGAGTPHMQLVVADTTASFSVNSTSATNYTTSNITLPAGTYVVRDERDYTNNVGVTKSFTVNNLSVNTVSGSAATFSNVNNGTIALTAADTYINNFRKGNASVAVTGPGGVPLLAGTQVGAHMVRIGFDFGSSIPGLSPSGVNAYLGNNGTTQQNFYQTILKKDFNTLVPDNMGKWQPDENTQGNTSNMSGVDTILNFAQANKMDARMHNLIWGNQQPTFVNNALAQGTAAAGTLNADINSRINYYVGTGTASDRAKKYQQIDVYNESYHTGSTVANSYWTDMGVGSIAAIYAKVQAVAPNVKTFTNEYNVYEDGADKYATWYQQHVEALRDAGFSAGLGNVVGGIGTQYYPDSTVSTLADPNTAGVSGSQHDPARVMQTLQNLSTEGLPITLTEFGVKSPGATGAGSFRMDNTASAGSSELNASQILSDTMRMVFGNPNSIGMMVWDWQAEGTFTTGTGTFSNGTFGTNMFQSESALYKVVTSGAGAWTNFQITPSGKVWEGLLGTGSYAVTGSDGKALSAWATPDQMLSVDANGQISLSGFYGDYNIGSQGVGTFSNLSFAKGVNNSASLVAPPSWSLWNATNTGVWGTAGNWTTGGVANTAGQTAYFGPAVGAKTITVDGAKTVGMIALDGNTGSYTIGGSTITLQGFNSTGGHLAAIYVASGSHEIDAPLSLADNTTVTVAPAASTLTVTNLQPTIASFSKAGAGSLAVNNIQAGALNINAGTLKIIPNGTNSSTSNVASLSIAGSTDLWSAKLDLTNNSMVIAYTGASPLAAIQNQIKNGYANGAWAGMGITSSSAAIVAGDTNNPVKTGLGFGEASALGLNSFAGQSITGQAIVMRYTLFGDANLDGVVNLLDLNALATNFGTESGSWIGGDFDYSGEVNIADFNALALNFGDVLPAPAPALGTLVPEPASFGFIIAVAAPFVVRKRRCANCSRDV